MWSMTFCLLYMPPIVAHDVRARIIPNRMTSGLLATAVCADISSAFMRIPGRLLCMACIFVMLAFVAMLTGGLGAGDVKLAAVLGYCIGPCAAIAGLLIASLLGMLVFAALASRGKRGVVLPFAPLMSAGCCIAMLVPWRLS